MRKLCLVTSHISKTQLLENASKGFEWESKIPYFSLVHDLCDIEVYIASFRNRNLISMASYL